MENSRFKFRMWKHTYTPSGSSDIGEMIYDIKLGNSIWNNEDIEINKILKEIPRLMQYTGLKDKNGKELYEGDVVRFTSINNKETIRIVEWDIINPCFVLSKSICKKYYEEYDFSQGGKAMIEIIGNLYENPELLKDKE